MIVIGIDPSIKSTGICVWDTENNINKYYNIVKNPTKKLKNFKSSHINILSYEGPKTKDLSAIEKEREKSQDVIRITNFIAAIIDVFKPSYINMEAVAFSASGRIDQLAGLNYCIRYICNKENIKINILTPQVIKKQFVGDGGANKDMMVEGWFASDLNALEYKDFPKNSEDLADSYAICHYKFDE